LSDIANYYAFLNNTEKSISCLEKALQLRPFDVNLIFRAADIYLTLGMKEKSFLHLEKALNKGYPVNKIMISTGFKKLQSDPEFRTLIDKFNKNNN